MEGNMRPVGRATNEVNEQKHQMPKPRNTGPESSSPPGMQEVPRLGVRVPDFGLAEVVDFFFRACTGLPPRLEKKRMAGKSKKSKKVFGSASNSNQNQGTRNTGASTMGKGNRIAHQVPSSSRGKAMRRVDKSTKKETKPSDVRKTAVPSSSKKAFGSASNSDLKQCTRITRASTMAKRNRIAHQVPSSSCGETKKRVDKTLDNVKAKMKIQDTMSTDVRRTAGPSSSKKVFGSASNSDHKQGTRKTRASTMAKRNRIAHQIPSSSHGKTMKVEDKSFDDVIANMKMEETMASDVRETATNVPSSSRGETKKREDKSLDHVKAKMKIHDTMPKDVRNTAGPSSKKVFGGASNTDDKPNMRITRASTMAKRNRIPHQVPSSSRGKTMKLKDKSLEYVIANMKTEDTMTTDARETETNAPSSSRGDTIKLEVEDTDMDNVIANIKTEETMTSDVRETATNVPSSSRGDTMKLEVEDTDMDNVIANMKTEETMTSDVRETATNVPSSSRGDTMKLEVEDTDMDNVIANMKTEDTMTSDVRETATNVPSSSRGDTMKLEDTNTDNMIANMKMDDTMTSDVRETATNVDGTIGRQLMKPKKIVPLGTRRNSKLTNEEISKFEAQFAINPFPTPTQVMEMCVEMNKVPWVVRRWFLMHRRKMGLDDEPSSSGVITSVPSPNVGEWNQSGIKFEPTGNQATVSGEQSNPTVSSDTREGDTSRVKKFLRDPEMRTLNKEVIKKDIENLKLCDLTEFRRILDGSWTVKANRLLRLLLQDSLFYCRTIRQEASIINHVIIENPFSASQFREIEDWKNRFLDDACFVHEVRDIARVHFIACTVIIPWIAPYIYSKTTMQDGRYLSLEVGLCDFCSISPHFQGGRPSWKWKTPSYLRHDDV